MRGLRAFLISLLLLAGLPLAAQEQIVIDPSQFPTTDSATPILTVDLDRLFTQSQFGERVATDYTEGRAALATENRRIADALREEELALTAQRPSMAPEVFQAEAEAFDEKTQGIRDAQDAKEQALETALSQGRDEFLAAARPILGELLVARGASVILDQRGLVLSLNRIDITDEAIARIDEVLGDGRTLDDPAEN